MKKQQILEALKMQPLSEEEKSARHILGRLYGPIATCNSSTRNGRRYNKELWERALSDDIFKEKIANKSLFLELGHPLDREETDMEKICACIPDMPQIVDGDLYAYVDILDTKNGQLLKTLCDYGFVPGISSRGSGDIMDNDEVDPETFFLETWDIVQLPAVKDARLAMCEGLDMKSRKLKQALTESYNKASDEDKKFMKEALDNLAISIDPPAEDASQLVIEAVEDDGIPMSNIVDDEIPESLLEDTDKEEEIEDEVEESEIEETESEDIEEPVEETEEEQPEEEEVEEEVVEPIFTPEDVKEVAQEIVDEIKEVEDEEEVEEIIEDKIEKATEEKVEELGQNSEESDDIEEVEVEEEISEDEEEIASEEEVIEEPEEDSEEAEDNGDEEVIESLKEMIRQKDLLESEVKDLKSSKAVSDAEVKKLKEELDKYKVAFARISEVAAKTKPYEAEINSLTEQLNQKDKEIKSIKQSQQTKLNESLDKTAKQVQSLTEKLTSKQKELEDTESKLTEQANVYKQKLTESAEVVKKYKTRFTETLNKYIDFRASMLGVRPAEITNRLKENFTLNDIDSVCETILDESVYMGNLPIGFNGPAKVKITESKQTKKTSNFDDECFKDLLDLADL